MQVLGRETLKMEREFNRLAGFTKADDRLPEWMCEEPNEANGAVFDVRQRTWTTCLIFKNWGSPAG